MVDKGAPDPEAVLPDNKFRALLKKFEDDVISLNGEHQAMVSAETSDLRSELDMMKRAYRQIKDELRSIKSEYKGHIRQAEAENAKVQEENKQLKIALASRTNDSNNDVSTLQSRLSALENAERRVCCFIDGDGLKFARDLLEDDRSGGLEAARRLTTAIKAHMKGSPGYKLWIFCFLNRRGLVAPLGIAEASLNKFISGFNGAGAHCFAVDIGQGKELADNRIRELMIHETKSSHTMRVYFGGCHDNGYAPSLEGLVTDGFKSKLFLLPGHVEVAASIRQLGLPSLNVPDLFNAPSAPLSTTSPVSAITSPTSPTVKSVGPVQDFAVALNNVFPTISGSTTSSDLQHVAQQKTEGQWMVPLHLKQPTRRSPVVVTPVKLYYLDPNIPVHKNNPVPCTRHYVLQNCPFGIECRYFHGYTFKPGDLKRMMDQLPLCPTIEKGNICNSRDSCFYRHHCRHGSSCTFYRGGLGTCPAGTSEAHRPLQV